MPGKFIRLFALYCCSILPCLAQKNLKEAVVVLNNADTVRGFIEYKEWFTNPSAVLFTPNKNAPVSRYTTADLNYFEITGHAAYQRHTIAVSLSHDVPSDMGGKDTSSETRTVFLKIVEQGSPLSLFSYRDDLKQRLYVLESNQLRPVELLNSVYLINGEIKEEKQYRYTLSAFATKYRPGNSRLAMQLGSTGYYTDDIADICRQIDGGAVKVAKQVTARGNESAFRIFAGGGINLGALTIDGNERFAGKNSQPFYFPLVDIGADIPFNPAVGKLIFRLQVHMTGYKTDGYIFLDYSQYTEEYFFSFKQQNIQVAPQLLYNIYNQRKVKWFAGAGVALNFSSYPINKMYFIRKSSTNAEATENNYLKYLRSAWLNLCFSTGISLNRFELAGVYYPAASITQSSGYGVDNRSIQLRLNFYLKK